MLVKISRTIALGNEGETSSFTEEGSLSASQAMKKKIDPLD